MFKLDEVTSHSFTYTCDCGATGRCMFVPVTGSGSLVMDLRCVMCEESERICIEKDVVDDVLQWAIILDNDLTSEGY